MLSPMMSKKNSRILRTCFIDQFLFHCYHILEKFLSPKTKDVIMKKEMKKKEMKKDGMKKMDKKMMKKEKKMPSKKDGY